MKNWGTQEQKGELMLLGASLLSGIISDISSDSKSSDEIIEEAKKDGKFSKLEYEFLEQKYKRYRGYVENIIGDTELGCQFKKTETYFLDIIWILMLDLESDYCEQIQSFTKIIDNVEFINSYEEAIRLREKRLDKEFESILRDYNVEMQQYNQKLKEYNGRTLSKFWNDKPIEPIKPERRK